MEVPQGRSALLALSVASKRVSSALHALVPAGARPLLSASYSGTERGQARTYILCMLLSVLCCMQCTILRTVCRRSMTTWELTTPGRGNRMWAL